VTFEFQRGSQSESFWAGDFVASSYLLKRSTEAISSDLHGRGFDGSIDGQCLVHVAQFSATPLMGF
jgi:hypothetical protein